jgi:hypothetical protein
MTTRKITPKRKATSTRRTRLAVLDPTHPRWEEFTSYYLFGKRPPKRWLADYPDRPFTRFLLDVMEGIDVEATLEHFEELGGYDEVEIGLNVLLRNDAAGAA